jgi:HK97 family phage major capsid protein
MTLAEIREALAGKTAELRAIIAAANGADLADNARTRFDQLEREARALNEQLARETRVAELERTAAATAVGGNATPDFDRELSRYSLLAAGRHAAGMGGDARREIEIGQELQRRTGITAQGILVPTAILNRRNRQEQRVLLSGTSGAGAIPSEHHPEELVSYLYNNTITAKLGARVLSGLQGNVTIPAVDTGSTSAWIAENGSLSAADADINSKTASQKHVGARTEVSRNMMLQSSPDVEKLFRDDMSANLGAAVDGAALVGGGSNQPTGITAALAGDLATFATPTWAEGLQMVASLDSANALNGSLGWAMHPSCVKKLRSTVRVASTDSAFIMDSPNELYGYQAQTSNALVGLGSPADRGIIFGNWADLLIAEWGAVDFLANPYGDGYAKGNVEFRALATVDVVVRRNSSFRVANDMQTA